MASSGLGIAGRTRTRTALAAKRNLNLHQPPASGCVNLLLPPQPPNPLRGPGLATTHKKLPAVVAAVVALRLPVLTPAPTATGLALAVAVVAAVDVAARRPQMQAGW